MTLRGYDRWRVGLTGLGVLVSGYLTLLHYDRNVPLVCSSGSLVNCEQVLTSPSSMVLGVPVAAFGLGWFLVALALAWASLRPRAAMEPPGLRATALAWTAAGIASVLWLIYEELGVVGKVCLWCTVVHLLVLALLVLQVLSDPLRTGHGPASG
ncbi:MAG: vitamin K epoxide reductase family protein [Gemmatimonadota bacterium]|nr:vitamin K epoxide reductase family protein [Gemmatimonadota bacterium]MDE3127639.1 vitamin K epoxide reductase family protein [Gemmatimonadota bacterium]MDE3171918.1 vitamin K epoxide reductase family protein [Gemmatimonadota bacterium]MDE3216362.1 vitamin K epoxide reductase family protein [Gemmatimonadota bacterium]